MAALFPEMTATVNNDEVDTPEEIDTPEEKLDTWRHDESPENINTDSPYWSAECPIHGINCYDKPLNLSDPAVLDYYIKLADSRQGKPYPVTPEAVCEWICRQPRPAQLPKDRYYAVDGIDRRPPYDGRVHPDGWHPNCCLHGSDAKHITGPRKLVRRGSTDGELDEDKLIELIRQFLLKVFLCFSQPMMCANDARLKTSPRMIRLYRNLSSKMIFL